MASTECRLVKPWRSCGDSRQALETTDALHDGDFFLRINSDTGRAFLRLESVVVDIDYETCMIFHRSRGVLGGTEMYDTQQLLGAKVKACGLTEGKLNTAIVLLVQQTPDPQEEDSGSFDPLEVMLYRLPDRSERAYTLSTQELTVHKINSFLEDIRGSPVETENDTLVSRTTGLCISDDVQQPLLPNEDHEEPHNENSSQEESSREGAKLDGGDRDQNFLSGVSEASALEASAPEAFKLSSCLPLCRPWQNCPCIPLLPSRFTITTQGSDLTVVSKPNLRALYPQLAAIWAIASICLFPLLKLHTLYFSPACLYLFYFAMETRAIVRSLSVNQVLRLTPQGFSITACYPDSAILRVLASGMALDGHVADMSVKETIIGAKVIVSPQQAPLSFGKPFVPIEVRLQTTKASYNLSSMLGVSMLCHEAWAKAACMSHRPWIQQDAEILVSAINHHLLAYSHQTNASSSFHQSSAGVCEIQNVLEASALSCMRRLGLLFESEASEKHRLGVSADSMLQQQRLAIRSLTSEHSGTFFNVLETSEAPLHVSLANSEHVFFASTPSSENSSLTIVCKDSVSRFIIIAAVLVFLPLLALWLMFAVAKELQIYYLFHHSPVEHGYVYHNDVIRFLAAQRAALMTSEVVCLTMIIDFYAICMLLFEFVRMSGIVLEVSEGQWVARRVARWSMLPRDDGMKCLRRWGSLKEPLGSRVIAQGTIDTFKGCEVQVTPRWFCKGQFITAVLHYKSDTSKARKLALITTKTGFMRPKTPATVSDVLLVAQEINRCLAEQHKRSRFPLSGLEDPKGPENGFQNSLENPEMLCGEAGSSENQAVVELEVEQEPSGAATETMLSEISTEDTGSDEQQRLL